MLDIDGFTLPAGEMLCNVVRDGDTLTASVGASGGNMATDIKPQMCSIGASGGNKAAGVQPRMCNIGAPGDDTTADVLICDGKEVINEEKRYSYYTRPDSNDMYTRPKSSSPAVSYHGHSAFFHNPQRLEHEVS